MIARRQFLSFAAASSALLVGPKLAFASVETDSRFVFIIQRGAADGLDIVRPLGDPGYERLRSSLIGAGPASIKLDGQFSLHPSLANTAQMYAKGEALFVHAVASPYRERSHFDGQNVLETGGVSPYEVKDGWLNRVAALMPKTAEAAVALAPTVPMALRGPAQVTSYAPSALPQAPDDLLARVGQLYANDAQLHPLWDAAMEARGMAGDANARQDPASVGKLAATFLVKADGPRIAMIETGGWDTHSQQAGRLTRQLSGLDAMVAALRDGMGPAWAKTTVVVATEFGRTAAANGTGGTDHGSASAVMLIGGAVKGGRVISDWPGLSNAALYEGRDLKPTTSLDAVIAAAAGESLGLDPQRIARAAFPSQVAAKPMSGLVRTV